MLMLSHKKCRAVILEYVIVFIMTSMGCTVWHSNHYLMPLSELMFLSEPTHKAEVSVHILSNKISFIIAFERRCHK